METQSVLGGKRSSIEKSRDALIFRNSKHTWRQHIKNTHLGSLQKKGGREILCDDRDDTTVGLDLGLGAARDVAGLDDDRVLGETALGEDLAKALHARMYPR